MGASTDNLVVGQKGRPICNCCMDPPLSPHNSMHFDWEHDCPSWDNDGGDDDDNGDDHADDDNEDYHADNDNEDDHADDDNEDYHADADYEDDHAECKG